MFLRCFVFFFILCVNICHRHYSSCMPQVVLASLLAQLVACIQLNNYEKKTTHWSHTDLSGTFFSWFASTLRTHFLYSLVILVQQKYYFYIICGYINRFSCRFWQAASSHGTTERGLAIADCLHPWSHKTRLVVHFTSRP